MERHSQAAAWGENPLLFSLAAVVFVKTGALPPSRATLYRDVVEAVLAMREQGVSRSGLLLELATLALWLHQSRLRTFTEIDLLRTFLKDIQGHSWEDRQTIARKITSSGLLEVVAHNTYGFRHQTFQEYLAAVELAQQLTSQNEAVREKARKFAWERRTYSRWTEVLRLVVGVLAQLPGRKGRAEAVRWLHQLADQRTTEEGDPGDLGLMLAIKSLVEVAEMDEWETGKTGKTAQLEKHVVALWLQELLDAARKQRETRAERFQKLAEDIAHLRTTGKEAVVERLIKALRDPDNDVQKAATQALTVLGTWVPVERLLPLLEDPDSDVRQAVVQVLGKRLPVEQLLLLLDDPNPEVQVAAIQALDEQIPVEQLLSLLKDYSWEVRRAAVQVLGNLGEHAPVDAIVAMLTDKDDDVREATIETLKKLKERVPVSDLLQFLYHKDEDIRRAALEVLETRDEQIPVEPLLEALSDEDSAVRQAAIAILEKQAPHVLSAIVPQALATLDGKATGDVFQTLAQMRVADTLGELGLTSTEAQRKLLELLDWPHWQVRMKAAWALGQIRRSILDDAIKRLLELRRDPDPRMGAVREAADDALAEILSLETGIEDELME